MIQGIQFKNLFGIYYITEETKCGGKVQGNALGPDWSVGVHLSGTLEVSTLGNHVNLKSTSSRILHIFSFVLTYL